MELGEVLGDRFVLEALAGEGGMGAVYRAHDLRSAKKVALKVLLSKGPLPPSAHQRFEHEAAVLGDGAGPGTAVRW